jgi:hypothetical protein
MTDPITPPDRRTEHAREVLAWFDRGDWSDPLSVVGHLAAAVRLLLEVSDEPPSVKIVLAIPLCSLCRDKIATVEVTCWGWLAWLCEDCADRYADPGAPRRELHAGPAEPPLPTEAEAGAYVEAQAWKRARPTFRGRPQAPHEYVLIWRSTDPAMQLRVLAFIREHGVRRRYGRDWHHYWQPGDGYEYWDINAQETILNRRHLSWPTTADRDI